MFKIAELMILYLLFRIYAVGGFLSISINCINPVNNKGTRYNSDDLDAVKEKAVNILLDKLEIVRQLLFGLDYSGFFSSAIKNKLSPILHAEDFILGLPDGKCVLFVKLLY